MQETQEQLVGKLRKILGNPGLSELTDEQIEFALENTLAEYSRHRPRKAYRVLNVVAGTSQYILPADVLAVEDVAFEPFGSASVGSDPGLQAVINAVDKTQRIMYGPDWEYNTSENILTLTPEPSKTSVVIYIAHILHSLESVSERDRAMFVDYACGEAKEIWGNARNKRLVKVPTATGDMTFDNGKALREEGALQKARAFSSLKGGSPLIYG